MKHLDRLQAEKEKVERKIMQMQHKIQQMGNREHYYEKVSAGYDRIG